MKILVLNAGSSSQKSCLYDQDQALWEASIDWNYHPGFAQIKVKTANQELKEEIEVRSRLDIINHMLETLWQGETAVLNDLTEIDAVGHRVVQGGEKYSETVRITETVKADIDRFSELAPTHNPANLEGIEAVEKLLGKDIPQFAVFDTAFHRQLPDAAAIYPVPYAWVEQGIRKYGFHGISHQYCANRAAELLNQNLDQLRLIVCHLGNGCSLSAIAQGHSIDTTMGFTPLDGLMMGTRSGSVDPGILIHLMRQGYDADRLDCELNKESGLRGISGVSGDLREVMNTNNDRAKLALDIYIHRLRSGIGSMLASLGGLDAIIFTAGVGENSAIVRSRTCAAFEFLGLKLDQQQNQNNPVDRDIATSDSTVRILVIHTQEDWAIAQECYRLLA